MNECTSQAAAGIVSFRDHVMCWFSTITYATYGVRRNQAMQASKQAGPKRAHSQGIQRPKITALFLCVSLHQERLQPSLTSPCRAVQLQL